jgi:glycosyltransferase involved in cell wall biosynthesis
MNKVIFIVWGRYHRRAELLAQHLNTSVFYISYGKPGRLINTLIKYPIQAVQTWKILRKEQPEIVFVQNPPIFCALVAYLDHWLFGSAYIIDSHTGAFLDSKWHVFLGLHRWLSKRALTTIVHNHAQENLIKEWECSTCVIGFTPGNYPSSESFPVQGKFNLAVISTYGEDEPLAIIFEAADRMPNVDFYITGDDQRITQSLKVNKPENCHLTGYLSDAQYVGLLRSANAVMDLTTRDETLLMGGFEAVSLGTPLITSDWRVLKDYFSLGTVHIPNTVEGVCAGVLFARENHTNLKREMSQMKEILQAQWEQKFNELQLLIQDYEAKKSTQVPSL